MGAGDGRTIVVTGATGRQGSAVTRHLVTNGWHVRAMTRNEKTEKARRLTTLGAEVVVGDMDDPASLRHVFRDTYGVFSLQNPSISGAEGERRQGMTVADIARESGSTHFVYASAGPGVPGTGVLQWDVKLDIEDHARQAGLPLTILRPMALMELMTDKEFYPAASTWHVMPKLAGATTPIPWIAAEDIGAVVAQVFAQPERFVGQDVRLAADVHSVDSCRAFYKAVVGKAPARFPMPVWLLERFAGADVTRMWRWLQTGEIHVDPADTRAIHPHALSVEDFVRRHARSTKASR
jgi:uncharacterized protein YbjT (DUF2867 family)